MYGLPFEHDTILEMKEWNYILDKLGLKKEIDSILADLMDAGIASEHDYRHHDFLKFYIPIKKGKIKFGVITTGSDNPLCQHYHRMAHEPWEPEGYEVVYEIENDDKDENGKISEILKKYTKFRSREEHWKDINSKIESQRLRELFPHKFPDRY